MVWDKEKYLRWGRKGRGEGKVHQQWRGDGKEGRNEGRGKGRAGG